MSSLNNETTAPYTIEDAVSYAKEKVGISEGWSNVAANLADMIEDGRGELANSVFRCMGIKNDADFTKVFSTPLSLLGE